MRHLRKKTILVLLLMIISVFTPFTIDAKSEQVPEKQISVSGLAGMKNGTAYTASYSDSYFSQSSLKQEKVGKLAVLSALASATTYTDHKTEELLRLCGFSEKTIKCQFSGSGSSSTRYDNDHATLYFGFKPIGDDTTLVALVIDGYSTKGYEWISNFEIGKGSMHAGFANASKEVVNRLNEYISSNQNGFKNKSKIKIWITGHSRGAALANVAAKQISGKYGASNVYAYGFATPRYTTKEKGSCSNIINFNSPHDFVPDLPPYTWGYGYYAKSNYVFSASKEKSMRSLYKKYTGRTYGGYTKAEKDRLIAAFDKLGVDSGKYSTKKYTSAYLHGMIASALNSFTAKDYCARGIAYAMTGDTELQLQGLNNLIRWSKNVVRCPQSSVLFGLLVDGAVLSSKIMDGHNAVAYLAWMEASL